MKIIATNPTNYNKKLNTKSNNSNTNPSFGMKVILDQNRLIFALGSKKRPANVILDELNNYMKGLNIDKIFNLAKQKLEVPNSTPIEDYLSDYGKRELRVEIEEPLFKQELHVSIYDSKKKIETVAAYKQLQPTTEDIKAHYKSTIIHSIYNYARAAIIESPVYRRYSQSSEHDLYLKSGEFKALQAQKK